jgi:hypothetical protein
VTSRVLSGTVPKKVKYQQDGGQVTAWALVIQDPKILKETVENTFNTKKALYTRFRASEAFEEMENDVKRFEEYKKEQGMIE